METKGLRSLATNYRFETSYNHWVDTWQYVRMANWCNWKYSRNSANKSSELSPFHKDSCLRACCGISSRVVSALFRWPVSLSPRCRQRTERNVVRDIVDLLFDLVKNALSWWMDLSIYGWINKAIDGFTYNLK